METSVKVYRRPQKDLIWSRVVLDTALAEVSGFWHGMPAFALAARGVVIVCGPGWEEAVRKLLASHHDGQEPSATREDTPPLARAGESRAVRRRQEAKGKAVKVVSKRL
jgi:hypothetical protein